MENEFNTLAPEDFSLVKLASGEQDIEDYNNAVKAQAALAGEPLVGEQEQKQQQNFMEN